MGNLRRSLQDEAEASREAMASLPTQITGGVGFDDYTPCSSPVRAPSKDPADKLPELGSISESTLSPEQTSQAKGSVNERSATETAAAPTPQQTTSRRSAGKKEKQDSTPQLIMWGLAGLALCVGVAVVFVAQKAPSPDLAGL